MGPAGGMRSRLPEDAGHLSPFFHSLLTCINESAWNIILPCLHHHSTSSTVEMMKCTSNSSTVEEESSKKMMDHLREQVVVYDLSIIDSDLRGFSNVVRLGRYIYFAPLQIAVHSYSSKVLRLFIHETDVGTTLLAQQREGSFKENRFATVMDLTLISKSLAGFSDLFTGTTRGTSRYLLSLYIYIYYTYTLTSRTEPS